MKPPVVNAHIHLPPNFSAFSSVADAIAQAKSENLVALGASNYYDFSIYDAFGDSARDAGIFPLFGLEILTLDDELQAAGVKVNDPGNPGRFYVCGKGISLFSDPSAEASALLDTIRNNDAARMDAMVLAMESVFATAGFPTRLDALAIRATIARKSSVPVETVFLQERHVARAFQEALFESLPGEGERADALARLFGAPSKSAPDDIAGIQNELRSHLMKAGKPAYVPETFVGFEHARNLILELGGIPCYPTLADGASPLCPFEVSPETLIENLRARQIFAAEWIPTRNSPETLARFVPALRDAGVIVTAGTEHNTPQNEPLTPTARGGAPIPDEVEAIFWEGARVVAAHQNARTNGEPGYVDDAGRLNPAFETVEERIATFAEKGGNLLARGQ